MSSQRLVVGVDIGNSTTEACLADVSESGAIQYLGSWLTRTTGVKGTLANLAGVQDAVQGALHRGGIPKSRQPDLVLINEATPVISGIAMETITETIITESTMMGHNPATPGGGGLGLGRTVAFGELVGLPEGDRVIVVIGCDVNFTAAAAGLSEAMERERGRPGSDRSAR